MRRQGGLLIAVGLLLVGLLASPGLSDSHRPSHAGAAPAVAQRLLAEAGIAARYGSGAAGGNHSADVAAVMASEPGTNFAGVAATDWAAYECAVATFLTDGVAGPPAAVSLHACPRPPSAPTDLDIRHLGGPCPPRFEVSWGPPDDDGGVPIEFYTASFFTFRDLAAGDGVAPTYEHTHTDLTALSFVLEARDATELGRWEVRASNAVGTSPPAVIEWEDIGAVCAREPRTPLTPRTPDP
jgi:hypothetical protein